MNSTPLTLVISALESRVLFALGRGAELVHSQQWLAPKNGAEILCPALDAALTRLGGPAVGRVAAVRGPGGFTGIRLAISTAHALASAWNAELAGLDYLEAVAACAPANEGESVRALAGAGGDMVYSADFLCRERQWIKQGETRVLSLEQTAALPFAGQWLAGTPAQKLAGLVPGLRLAPQPRPGADTLLALAEKAVWSRHDIEPLYLRPCDAENNLPLMARKAGRDPADFQADLKRLTTLGLEDNA